MAQVVVSDRIRVPAKLIPKSLIQERYDIDLFDDSKCVKCENFQDRSPTNELCKTCKAFNGSCRFFSTKEYKEDKVWSLPQADTRAVKRLLTKLGRDFDWRDERKTHYMKMRDRIKFKGTLYREGDVDERGNPRPNQMEAIEGWRKHKTGIICAPPRSGKTVLSTALYCMEGVRTVIIADKKDLLNQFYETACGVPAPRFMRGRMVPSTLTARRKAMTNIPTLQRKTGREIIFMPTSYANLRQFMKRTKEVPDILLVTYQSYVKEPERIAKIINKYYSLGIIDEQHGAGANAYLSFTAGLDLKYRCGLSATPDRKDGRSRLTSLVFGPVVATIRTTTLRPSIKFKHSKAVPTHSHTSWVGAFKWIINSKARNVEIVAQVFKDLRAGHNAIIIPVDYKGHLELLIRMINHQAKKNREKRGEKWPKELAKGFHSGIRDRLKVLNWVDETPDAHRVIHPDLPTKSPRVLVAIRSMIKQGIDLSRPSALYAVLPMSAKKDVGAPMARQMFTRVATPFADKPAPIVRYWIDNVGMFASCATGLLYNEVLPRSNLNKKEQYPQYTLTSEEYEKAKLTLSLVRTGSKPKPNSGAKFW